MRPLLPLMIVVSVALGLWASAPLCWAGLAEGVAAYKQGDFTTAMHELLPHAQHGHAAAQFYLGMMSIKGWGVPQDLVEAYLWFHLAAAGSPTGGSHDKAVQVREAVAAQLTPEQLAHAQALARQWHPHQEP